MADTTLKRPREDSDESGNKRQKPYNDGNSILSSFLDQGEEEPIQDLSSFLSSIQEELSSPGPVPENHDSSSSSSTTFEDYDYDYASSSSNVEEGEERERVIRHLLEASDDELGIPTTVDNGEIGVVTEAVTAVEEGDGFGINYDGLWEFEDLNANYYTLLQSELFM